MVKLNVIKLDGKWGCFNSKENSISLNIGLWEKHQSYAWVLSTFAHEYTHWKSGHDKRDCPEFEYLAQSVANEILCKKYKYNAKNALFKKNDVSLAKWKKLLPVKGVHYALKLKAKKLADEFWNSDEFWKLFKTANELGGIQVKNETPNTISGSVEESPNTIGGSVSKIQVAQPGEPDCKAYKQGVNTTPTVENKKEVLNMSIIKTVEVVGLNHEVIDEVEDLNGNKLYFVVDTCDEAVNEELEILLNNYPLHGCDSCSYTVDKAVKDFSEHGSFRCQNCGNFNYFLFEEVE